MSIAIWCVLIAALLPIVCAGLAKSGQLGKRRSEGGYDNHDPRAWLARQQGWRQRANAAQANSFEALPLFIGAVAIAISTGAPAARVDLLAAAFVGLRLAYIALYLADKATLRSLVWAAALAVNIGLLFSGTATRV
ncbi:MAPEG family protein [Eleftheria terrae]|uniref:MAPEG family protein n=1 Tax=Eleftheria terrae TaxID=1597781 RepID=UPI00263A55F3|nr:MAPEG family protein [Eleftheria terrae]WKB53724.1 MAPEG family protein [Eleftheria terrae]